ncbi:MAG: hypothetical protein JO318_15315 [Chloroflexi bacterium]|nr:hypothetical protein [Chloroflexota bacterium]MBV9134070.1 hypothetical protein [Chloroflexota bacterium]
MAVSVPRAHSPATFDRHIKRLIWCALIGSLALVIAATEVAPADDSSAIAGLGAIIIVIAGMAVVKDVGRYVRFEASRRAEAARRSTQRGACQAAEAIQDRVANLLSVTVGYVDFLSEDEDLPTEARAHAQRALESALAATRAVSNFRTAMGCGPSTLRNWQDLVDPQSHADLGISNSPWRYQQSTRTVRTLEGTPVAVMPPGVDEANAIRTGRLLAGAPILRDALSEAQHVMADLLTNPHRSPEETDRLREVVDRVNEVMDRVDA